MDWARILACVTRTVDQELLARNDSVTDAEVVGNTRSPAGRPELALRSRFVCVILSQGHDISGDIGELVVGKQRVRHAPLPRHLRQRGDRASQ
jgi:hypothetical protein